MTDKKEAAGVPAGNGMNRRDFLKMGAAGVAGASLLGVAGCGGGGGNQGGSGKTQVTFSFGPDDSGTLQQLIDRFNENNQDIEVSYREMPADTGQYFDQLRTEFQAGGGDIDLIGGDVIWPAQFAANGWIADLSDRFPEDEQSDFLDGPIEANTYEGAIYGVPWYTDAGMMYYRSDIVDSVPETWEEFKQVAQQAAEDSGTKFAFIFQGAQYEGGVVDGLEYIWTHGGRVLPEGQADEVVIDSQESISGLQTERSMVEEGIAPQAVATYKEQETQTAFLSGDAVFARNWPYMYALAADEEQSSITQDQIGVGPIPVSGDSETASGLGGWNLFINASADPEVQDAAYEFIQFLTASEQQKFRALEGAFLPTLTALYDDQEILDQVPVIDLGKTAIQSSRPRPVSPVYSDMSLKMAEQFNASLKGEIAPDGAISTLQTELSDIVEQAQG